MSGPQAQVPANDSSEEEEAIDAPKQAPIIKDTEYGVGDIVWAKIGHRWWPGQIHDPKNASFFSPDDDGGAQEEDGGKLVVAFYGGDFFSFSWCGPDQISPFVETFGKFSKGGGASRSNFSNAVNEALADVGRALVCHMTCACVPADVVSRLENESVGVPLPEVDAGRLSLPNYGAYDVFSRLANFAREVPSESVLDLAVVRGWISAFQRWKGIVDGLQEYQEFGCIEDDVCIPTSPQEEEEEEGMTDAPPNKKRKISDVKGSSESSKKTAQGANRAKVSSAGKKKKDKGKVDKGPKRKKKKNTMEAVDTKDAEILTPREKKKSKFLLHHYAKERSDDVDDGGGGGDRDDAAHLDLKLSSLESKVDSTDRKVRRADRGAEVVDDGLSQMNTIQNKLQIAHAILRSFHDRFNEDDTEILKVEIRDLSETVEAFYTRVNELALGTKLP